MLAYQFDTDDGTIIKKGGYDMRKLDRDTLSISLSNNRDKFYHATFDRPKPPPPKDLSTLEKFEHIISDPFVDAYKDVKGFVNKDIVKPIRTTTDIFEEGIRDVDKVGNELKDGLITGFKETNNFFSEVETFGKSSYKNVIRPFATSAIRTTEGLFDASIWIMDHYKLIFLTTGSYFALKYLNEVKKII